MVTASRTFLIHVQPERFEFMTESDVLDIAARIEKHWPERCTVVAGDDDGRYVNISLDSETPDETWPKIKRSFVDSKLPGGELRIASIITMTGDSGWDDYLLLHHFDGSESLDPYPKSG